jgi:hypothetical protein
MKQSRSHRFMSSGIPAIIVIARFLLSRDLRA